MSLYELQRCLFDYLRAMENATEGSPRPELSVEGFDLTDAERDDLGEGRHRRDIRGRHPSGDRQRLLPGDGL